MMMSTDKVNVLLHYAPCKNNPNLIMRLFVKKKKNICCKDTQERP